MRRRAEDVIPADILAAAKAAGLKAPLWYVGRRNGPVRSGGKTLHDVVMDARREAGICTECFHGHPLDRPHTGDADPLGLRRDCP